ncbi:Peptide deformylase [Verrucomicrobia bacterium]|nr:Peptide deformylase [Verrucomicrobiota bacterium]
MSRHLAGIRSMLLEVVKFGTPVLRAKGARIDAVTPTIKALIADMLETMYASKGIGLAAQQVGLPLQLTVLDVRGVTDRPSSLEIAGQPADVNESMPLVLINPEIHPVGTRTTGPEGCLSFPEIFADITRPGVVDVRALDREGEPLEFRCGGLLARAVQHEFDHLHGILFIDRMDKATKEALRPDLDALQAATKVALKKKQ